MGNEDQEPPSVKWGEPGLYEDWLVGNKSGFTALRDAIDEVIADGTDTTLPEKCDCDFQGLTMASSSGSQNEEPRSGYLASLGCGLAIVAILGLLALGAWKLVEIILN